MVQKMHEKKNDNKYIRYIACIYYVLLIVYNESTRVKSLSLKL